MLRSARRTPSCQTSICHGTRLASSTVRWTCTSCHRPVVTDCLLLRVTAPLIAEAELASSGDVDAQVRGIRLSPERSQVGACRRGAEQLEPHPLERVCKYPCEYAPSVHRPRPG